MTDKLNESLRKALANPDDILSVIVIGTSPSALDQLREVQKLKVIRVIKFINAIAARVRARDIVSLSESPLVQSIELDQEASTTEPSPTHRGPLAHY